MRNVMEPYCTFNMYMLHGHTLKSATPDYNQRHVIAFRPVSVAARSWSYDSIIYSQCKVEFLWNVHPIVLNAVVLFLFWRTTLHMNSVFLCLDKFLSIMSAWAPNRWCQLWRIQKTKGLMFRYFTVTLFSWLSWEMSNFCKVYSTLT